MQTDALPGWSSSSSTAGRAEPHPRHVGRKRAWQTHNRRRPRAGGSGRDVGTNCSANDGTTRSHLLDHVGDRQTYMITFSTSYSVSTDRNIQYIDSEHHMQDFCSRFNEKFKGGAREGKQVRGYVTSIVSRMIRSATDRNASSVLSPSSRRSRK